MSESWVKDYDNRLDEYDKTREAQFDAIREVRDLVKQPVIRDDYTEILEQYLLSVVEKGQQAFCRCYICHDIVSADTCAKVLTNYKDMSSSEVCIECMPLVRDIEDKFDIELE